MLLSLNLHLANIQNASYVPGTLLSPEDTEMNKMMELNGLKPSIRIPIVHFTSAGSWVKLSLCASGFSSVKWT